MALKASDVFVVQQSTGAQALAKVTAYDLNEWLSVSGGTNYVGQADFTDSSAEPATKNDGDLYFNTTVGTFAWTNPDPAIAVDLNSKAIWNGTFWDVVETIGDSGVEKIDGALPITVDDTNKAEPIIGVNAATTTTSGVVILSLIHI